MLTAEWIAAEWVTAEWIAAIQTKTTEATRGNPDMGLLAVVAMVAAVLGLVVLIFVRSSARQSSRR
jgi:hypothetical protein